MGAQMKTPDNRHFEGTSKEFARSQRIGLRRALIALLVLAFLAGVSLVSRTLRRVSAEPGTGAFSTSPLSQDKKAASDELWQPLTDTALLKQRDRRTLAQSYSTRTLNRGAFEVLLSQAPLEFTDEAVGKQVILTLPMPNGELERFRIEESPIMEQSLADEHPEIKTYSGQGIDDPLAAMRLDWTPLGLHAIVISLEGTSFVEPVSRFETTAYISYFNHDISSERLSLSCLLSNEEIEDAERRGISLNQGPGAPAFVTGATLRTYRLAVAATGEFTQQFGGGNVNTTLAQITTLINLVDAVYRKEATITFQLIANETSIIFTNPATDGYTNGTPSTMLAENQAKLDSVIGSANYDIGHVLGGITVSPGFVSFSGVASLGVVCGGSKARGVSTMGGGSSFPHSIFVSGVTHEFAHQFSAPHTFNSTTSGCAGQRSASGAYEPGSGSTIMGYSICGSDNIQNLPDLYFHTGSLEQIVSYAAGPGSCASTTATSNGAPNISPLTNFTIPANTPFALNASVTDPNGDPLTFVWEEFDLGAASPPNTDDGTRPIFRSFLPTSNTTRTFPRLQYILNNANVPPTNYSCGSGTCLTGELLPSTTRSLNFRFTARDNRSSGGGTANSPMQVSVVSTAGPFAVTQPNTAVSWTGGSSQLVSWNVAATASAPINCANVKISLSTDGGNTFPLVVSASTPNDGSENVIIPNSPTSLARIKIEAVGNIFFDISNVNFIITPGSSSHPDTIGLYRPAISAFYLRNSNTVGFPDLSISYGAAGDMPVVGDWDGNGTTTIGLYRPIISTFYLRNSNSTGAPDIIVSFGDGPGGDIPIVGDWDGDGDTTIGVYRPSTATFYLRNTNTPGFPDLSIPFGALGDLPIVGDWDGNGTTTIGVFRPGGSVFYLRNSNSIGFPDLSISYGAAGDLPIVGDWDGNGTVTIGLYRTTGGIFYLRNSNSAGFPDLSIPYGAAGDKPIAGDWDGL
jgi:reprolysin-like metallo-peptidase family M12B